MADIKAIKGTDGTTYNLRDDYSQWGGVNYITDPYCSVTVGLESPNLVHKGSAY
jgi:hypothetical protein